MIGLLFLLLIVGAVLILAGVRRRIRARRRRVGVPSPARSARLSRLHHRWRSRVSEAEDGRPCELTVEGCRRQYLFYRPEGIGIGAPPPLLVVFHGGFGNPLKCARLSRINEAADRHGFAVVYPAAEGHWADGRSTTGSGLADVEFVAELCDRLCLAEGLDRWRTYAVGSSNGGMFVLRLAVDAPHVFAAFAANMASLPTPLAREARPGPPVPLMMVNGVHDALIPWHGGTAGGRHGVGGTVIAVEETVDFWRKRNRCAAPQVTQWWGEAMDTEAAAELYDFPAQAGGERLRFLKLLRHGHDWPSAIVLRGGAPDGAMVEVAVIDMTWEFLSLHALRGDAAGFGTEARQPGGYNGH